MERPVSIVESVFHVDPKHVPKPVRILLDRTLKWSELEELLKQNRLTVSKVWTPHVDRGSPDELLKDFNVQRMRVSDSVNSMDVVDFGFIRGGEDELDELLANIFGFGVHVFVASEYERHF
jgi:hypothetical protein